MSDYMPFEIQEQIILRLPVKLVIQCRSVSKPWKYLIDSSEFIARYRVCHTNPPESLLLRYKDPIDLKENYVTFVDDETFPKQMFALTVPQIIKKLDPSILVGNCEGLMCLYGFRSQMTVLWNPSIRKMVVVGIPILSMKERIPYNILGFGVCPSTSNPKIIRICDEYTDNIDIPYSRKVKAFALSTRTWRSLSSNLPRKSITIRIFNQVVLGRFIYWEAFELVCTHDAFWRIKLIISFDLTNEEFGEVYLPDRLAAHNFSKSPFFISKLRDSLVVIDEYNDSGKQCYDVWRMEDDVPKLFVKLFSIKAPDVYIYMVLGFRKTGEPILKVGSDGEVIVGVVAPAVYEPYLEQVNKIHSYGQYFTCIVQPYMESLILLDQPNCSSYLDIDEDEDAN